MIKHTTAVVTAGLATLLLSGSLDVRAGIRTPVTPVADTAALMPSHGTVSIAPAQKWEDSLATGNGIMGALLAGDPAHETVIVNHCKLWLPLGSREIVPNVGNVLPQLRQIIGCLLYTSDAADE